MNERILLWRRAAILYESLRQRARQAGKCLGYSSLDLAGFLECRLTDHACPYCAGPLSVENFVLEDGVPILRGGRHTLRNLGLCCPDCHVLKGTLDAHEFRELRALLAGWPRPVQADFLARLRAGAGAALPLPPVGSLDWFRPQAT
jgi:hypothetical protein